MARVAWNKGIKTGLVPKSVFKIGHKSGMFGKKHTEETKNKIRMKKLGVSILKYKKWSLESRQAMSDFMKSNSPKGERHHSWKGGKPKCLTCAKVLSTYKSVYCAKCLSKIKVGENHHRYIKDRTQLKKSENKWLSSAYITWAMDVKKRDLWKCKINSVDCNGRLESHHILNWKDYPELRYDINNGITLCRAHHPLGRAKEKAMVSYFTELLTSKEQF